MNENTYIDNLLNPSYFKSIAQYVVNDYVNNMMSNDTRNLYYHYINESNYYLNQINNNQTRLLWIEQNNIYLNLNGNTIKNDLKNFTEIENSLSNYFRIQINIIKDVEDLVSKKRINPYIVFIPIFLIPTFNFNIKYVFDIYNAEKEYFDSRTSTIYRNLFTYSSFLLKRFDNNIINDTYALEKIDECILNKTISDDQKLFKEYFIQCFLKALTHDKKSAYIIEWLTHFFKTLRRRNEALILIGNKNVSEEIFYNQIIKSIFETEGMHYCITLTEEILENKSVGEIIANKLFVHINFIPENDKLQQKLKELLISLFTKKNIYSNNSHIPIQSQVIFTLDHPHEFLKDFLSSSKIFFIDTMENILINLNLDDEILLYKNIVYSIDKFSSQLSSLPEKFHIQNHSNLYNNVKEERTSNFSANIVQNDYVKFKENDYQTDNELFKNWLKNPELMKIALSHNSKNPILDPFHDSFESILPKEERYKHTYITGKTGSGKSELLKTLIYRDILRDDCSVILLDIHGDLAHSVTRLVKDKERLVLIDPILEENFSPTINLFHTEDKSELNIEQIAQMISTIINEINLGDDSSGSMIDILENCISILVRSKNKDFYNLKELMEDVPKVAGTVAQKDRIESERRAIRRFIDKFEKNKFEEEYFRDEFMEIGNSTRQAVKRRLNKMLKDSIFSNLTNGENTINLEKQMNSHKNKVIIFNIPKAKMLNTYKHYIKFIIGLIQIIALKRADIKDEKKRHHTHLYIDEFHNFITPTIEEILTESRKYKLFLTFAHQSISQIKNANLRDIILDNTNVKIIGKNSNKTLDMINKTLDTKLENVSKLEAGEFNLQSGTNDVIKIKNSDRLLDDKEYISDEQWEEHKKYQLEKYYRSTKKEDVENQNQLKEIHDLDNMLDKFIYDIKTQNSSLNSCFKTLEILDEKRYEEIIEDFNYVKDDIKYPRIRQQEINIVFQIAFKQSKPIEKNLFFKMLKEKDPMFEEAKMMTRDKKYRGDNPQEKYYTIPV